MTWRFTYGLALFTALWLGNAQVANAQNPCLAGYPMTIVVIGSSTAAGSGPSPVDSAWVWRYRAYMQSINPANQVINIARGGYTTYQMMPTGFVPPSGRPNPDTARNITKALSFNPDAIIINFPSNDVSNGFSVAEQLYNDSLVLAVAANAGVPVWISTTQPKNYGVGSTNTQKQFDVRDSILARYPTRALDFWTTIADPNGQIDSLYDSGDGTHLNNQGHWILVNRVIAASIPDSIYQPAPWPDGVATDIQIEWQSLCGDTATLVKVSSVNLGVDVLSAVPIKLQVQELNSGNTNVLTNLIPGGQNTCESDTVVFAVNTTGGGTYTFTAWTEMTGDGDNSNDTLSASMTFSGYPVLTVTGDTGCSSTALQLTAQAGADDVIRWYDSFSATTPIAFGTSYTTALLTSSDTFWVQAVRGDQYYQNSILTTATNNINWNGAMLDFVADSGLVIDSFALKSPSLGSQMIRCYYKTGTHRGYEGATGLWSLLGEDTVNVVDPDQFFTAFFDTLAVAAGDTVGLYFHMVNSGSTIRYHNAGAPGVYSTPEAQILTGTGIAYTFGATYYPRNLNCEAFYHFGYKPDGDCQTGLTPVPAIISTPTVNIGPDTILNSGSLYTLDAGAGYAAYAWSDGSTSQTLQLDGNVLGNGIFTYIVQATDSAGCMASDTVIVVFAPLAGTSGQQWNDVRIWPNPSNGIISWQSGLPLSGMLKVFDLQGREMTRQQVQGTRGQINISQFPQGMYLLQIEPETGEPLRKQVQILH